MAWMCSASTNDGLVSNLVKAGYVVGRRVEAAMRTVDRKWFVPHTKDAYMDSPQAIGDNATISAPHMHAHALSCLETRLQPGANVLDVGSGSGYLTACMANLVGPSGRVVGVEHVERLNQLARKALDVARSHHETDLGETILVTGDGRKGVPEYAPYDCIHVGAAASDYPTQLLEQLKDDGLLYIPETMPRGDQAIILYHKQPGGHIDRRELLGVRYVPLTSLKQQLEAY